MWTIIISGVIFIAMLLHRERFRRGWLRSVRESVSKEAVHDVAELAEVLVGNHFTSSITFAGPVVYDREAILNMLLFAHGATL